MKKYIVLPIALSVKNNRVAKSGQLVDDSELNTNASDLIKDGFLREATEEEIEASKKDEVVLEAEVESDDKKELDEEKTEETKQNDTPELSKKDEVKNALKTNK